MGPQGSDQQRNQTVSESTPPKSTPLTEFNRSLGGRMVPFAGYEMPLQFEGIMAEHNHTRSQASLFDVSHMGQVRLSGPDAAAILETLVPGEISALAVGRMRYTQFTNAEGGILDDLMVTRFEDHLFMVVNAAVKDADIALMRGALGTDNVDVLEDRALVALQGPAAAAALSSLAPAANELSFMEAGAMNVGGIDCLVSRSGYTGEDGYEISTPSMHAASLADRLLGHPDVAPAGLGARDSLRLEAGLCLYGHDIDETTTPIEAALAWSIGKRRREEGGFPGADTILKQLRDGATRKRVGFLLEGRAPAREGAVIENQDGHEVGQITSGGFGPTIGAPVAMGYVDAAFAQLDTQVNLVVRGKRLPARVTKMPFVAQRYHKS
jgi:aminomethyltransferase